MNAHKVPTAQLPRITPTDALPARDRSRNGSGSGTGHGDRHGTGHGAGHGTGLARGPGKAPRTRTRPFPSVLRNPLPWVAAALAGNLVLYVATVIHEARLSQWRVDLAAQKQQNVQLRATLSGARSLAWVDTRARALGLVVPGSIAYLPPQRPPQARRPAGPVPLGAAEGF